MSLSVDYGFGNILGTYVYGYSAAKTTTCFALMHLPPWGLQRLKEHIELLSTVEEYSCSSKSLCLQ